MAASDGKVSTEDLSPMVASASKQFGVPEELIWNVIRAENSGSPKGAANLRSASSTAVSPKNARGVMQVTPVALQDVKESGLIPSTVSHEGMSVQDQINVGTAYLSKLQKLSDKPAEIYAMYNYGPKARFRMDQLPEETRGYLTKTGQSESTSVRTGGGNTGTFGQGMMNSGDLIKQLQATVQGQNSAIDAAAGRAQAGFNQSREFMGDAVGQQRELVQQAATNAGAKAAVDYAQNSAFQDIQRAYGMDMSQANNEISRSLAEAQVAREARVSARSAYDEVASRDLLTNPIGYLIGQLQMPALAAKNNALADQEDLALQNIDTRTRQLAAAKNTLTANTADQIREVQLEQAKIESKMASAKLTVEEAKNAAAMAGNELQMASIENVKGDNIRNTLSTIASMEDRDESREIRKMQKEDVLKSKRDKEEEDARLNARFATGSRLLGMVEPMTLSRLKTLTNKDQQQAWLYYGQNGQLGPDMESALGFYLGQGNKVNINNTGGSSVRLTAEKLAAAGASYEVQAAAQLQAANGGKASKKEDARTLGYKMYQESVVNSMSSFLYPRDLSSSFWDTTYNPGKAEFLSFNKVINENPRLDILKNNTVKLMVDDLVKSGAVKGENLSASQQQAILGGMGDLVTARKLDPKVAAAQIAAYFSASSAFNRELNKADRFGLPFQQSYFFTMEGNFGAGNRKKVDLMNAGDVENALIWRARQYQPDTSKFPGTFDPFGVITPKQ